MKYDDCTCLGIGEEDTEIRVKEKYEQIKELFEEQV
jgi:hypothetical protein